MAHDPIAAATLELLTKRDPDVAGWIAAARHWGPAEIGALARCAPGQLTEDVVTAALHRADEPGVADVLRRADPDVFVAALAAWTDRDDGWDVPEVVQDVLLGLRTSGAAALVERLAAGAAAATGRGLLGPEQARVARRFVAARARGVSG